MNGFKVIEGIGARQVEKIIVLSKSDTAIINYTTDATRFKDTNSFEKWRKKKRTIYTLVDQDNNLLGIVWFGEKKFPKIERLYKFDKDPYGITFAIRLYGKARGVGLSNWFMKKVFDRFEASSEYKKAKRKGFWLETMKSNVPAVKTYKRFGFKKVGETDKDKIIMVYTP